MSGDESFKEHPQTIGEIRSGRSGDADDWTPRDALVSLLRLIDNGDLDPKQMVICMKLESEFCWRAAGVNSLMQTVGLVEVCKNDILKR